MIGRSAIGYPWIFREIKHFFATGNLLEPPTLAERIEACRKHLHGSVQWKGEKLGILEMRRHYASYLKGMPGVKDFRNKLVLSDTLDGVEEILAEVVKFYDAIPA